MFSFSKDGIHVMFTNEYKINYTEKYFTWYCTSIPRTFGSAAIKKDLSSTTFWYKKRFSFISVRKMVHTETSSILTRLKLLLSKDLRDKLFPVLNPEVFQNVPISNCPVNRKKYKHSVLSKTGTTAVSSHSRPHLHTDCCVQCTTQCKGVTKLQKDRWMIFGKQLN